MSANPPHSFCYASGLPSCSDEKIYANLVDFILSAIPKMYFQQAEHNPPHFHVMCGEYMGAFDIQTLEMMEGDLPVKSQALVRQWAARYRNELLQIWNTQEFVHLPPLE